MLDSYFLLNFLGIRARFHQYFIYGETVDCSHWKKDFEQCKNFRNKSDLTSLVCNICSLIDSYYFLKFIQPKFNVGK